MFVNLATKAIVAANHYTVLPIVARIGSTFPDSRPWTRNLDPYALARTPHSPPPQDTHHLLYLHDTLSSPHHAL
jgi:hypothetical protein